MPFMQAGKKVPDDVRVMKRTYQAAVALLAQDPSAAPAHVFIGGKNTGALVAAHAATTRMRIEGLFLLGFPLHKQDDPSEPRSEQLFRAITPMLFVQGQRDRHCDLPTLRKTLGRVGRARPAPRRGRGRPPAEASPRSPGARPSRSTPRFSPPSKAG